LGRHADALEHLRRAVHLAANQPAYHCALVRSLVANQREDEALAAAHNAAGQFQDHGELHQLLGNLLARKGQHREAAQAYRRAVDLLTTSPGVGDERLWIDLAGCYEHLEQLDQAIQAVREGLGRLPESRALQRELSRLQETAQFSEAEKLGRRAAALVSQIGNEDEAVAVAQEALKLSDRIYQPYYALGEIAMRRQEWERAVEYFEKAVSLSPSPGAVYAMRMQLAQLYERLGRDEAATAVRTLLS